MVLLPGRSVDGSRVPHGTTTPTPVRRKNTFSRHLQRGGERGATSSLNRSHIKAEPSQTSSVDPTGEASSPPPALMPSVSAGVSSSSLPRSPTRAKSASREVDGARSSVRTASPQRRQKAQDSAHIPLSSSLSSLSSSSSSSLSEESVYSAYDFVNDVIQDILLDPSDGDEAEGPAPPAYYRNSSERSRRRRSAASTSTSRSAMPHWLDLSGGGLVADGASASWSSPLFFFSPIALRRSRRREREEPEEKEARAQRRSGAFSVEEEREDVDTRKPKRKRVRTPTRVGAASSETPELPGLRHTRLHPAPKVRGTPESRAHGIQPLLPRPSGIVPFTLSVVLDVDETMVSAREAGAQVQLRPFLAEFIHACHALRCEVIVWTAASAMHANSIFVEIAKACRMELWYHHAITRHPRWFEDSTPLSGSKDLRRLQRDLARVVMIENNPASIISQPENAILVEDYTRQDEADQTFYVLKQVIQQLVNMLFPSPSPPSPAFTTIPSTTSTTGSRSRSRSPHHNRDSPNNNNSNSGGGSGVSNRVRRQRSVGAETSVPEALAQIPEIAKVMIGPAKKENMDAFALKYSPAAPGTARRYGDIEST